MNATHAKAALVSRYLFTVLTLALAAGFSRAGTDNGSAQSAPVVPGERLSDWLLRNTGTSPDLTALHWRVDAERVPQGRLRNAVISSLQPAGQNSAGYPLLISKIAALPLTGRLTLVHSDARWLQGKPSEDPVLQVGQTVVVLARPKTVAVVSETGAVCLLPHWPGAVAAAYINQCFNSAVGARQDWAWIAQPDGRTMKVSTANWNGDLQPELAPGAWIWAPSRGADITEPTSDNLIRFLATQLPAEAIWPEWPVVALASESGRNQNGGLPLASFPVTASDWGEIGLLQTPSARMAPQGDARLHMSGVYPYTRLTAMLQPLDWLEFGFRYTDIANRLYGASIAGDQSFKDKSIDLKLKLLNEGYYQPQVAVGLRDIGGTGLFSSEYLVGSKRWGNWDASVGLAWGYLGSRSDIANPLDFLSGGNNARTSSDNTNGGTVNTQSAFKGRTAFFGGIQWQPSQSPWILKLELDGNDYSAEPLNNNLATASALNFGAVYRYSPYVDLSMGWERGNKVMLGLTLHTGLNKLNSPKLLDPTPPRVVATAPAQLPNGDWRNTIESIGLLTNWNVLSLANEESTATLIAETDGAMMLQHRVDRAVAVLHRDAPGSIKSFVLQLRERGLALSRVEINRAEWVLSRTQVQPPALKSVVQDVQPGNNKATLNSRASAFQADVRPMYSQTLGGPDGFLLYQLGVDADLSLRLAESTWVDGVLSARLADNYQNFKYTAPSDLPRVRTFQREYLTSSRLTMPLLQMTHVSDWGGGHYTSVYGGMLESMYGGVGGEWLYRPWQKAFAVGVDVNRVKQRDFNQNFAFRDYEATTGHATLYWDTGWNDVQVKLSAGQYLAGDVGGTLDAKRVFPNGVAIGAFATKTNVSADQFGEGSFDKGIYITIPFDVMLPRSAAGSANINWKPLTRDGGAMLSRAFTLFDLTQQRDSRAWKWTSEIAPPRRSAEDLSFVRSEASRSIWSQWVDSNAHVAQQAKDLPASTWLWAGSAILASGLLDTSVDSWAKNHQSDKWANAAKLANAVPYAIAMGTGALLTGVAGDSVANTAKTSLMATGTALGINLLGKLAVGRSRPSEELGSASFNGFTSQAAQSGFASNHVTAAFALVTPFAQRYQQPWLYGLAATSALGRIQNREHFLSDTLAGGLLGYAMGTVTANRANAGASAVNVWVGTHSIVANWKF